MTANGFSCCGNCHHWAPNYEPTPKQMDAAPVMSLPVVREPEWGWCTRKAGMGNWYGYPKHKATIPNVGVETHYEGACDEHKDKPCKFSGPSSGFSDSPISPID